MAGESANKLVGFEPRHAAALEAGESAACAGSTL